MSRLTIDPFEPEEAIGKLWHAFASRLDAPASYEDAAVGLDEVTGRLAVFFRGLGGTPAAEIRPAAEEVSAHRLSRRRRLAMPVERLPRPSFDGEILRLPPRIASFAERELNAGLYFWVTAAVAHAGPPADAPDLLRADLQALVAAAAMTRATLADCPGLAPLHRALARACLASRPSRTLPAVETAIEETIIHMLCGPVPESEFANALMEALSTGATDFSDLAAPRGYRPFLPVPLWPQLRTFVHGSGADAETDTPDGPPNATPEGTRKARRKKAGEPERKDSLILHKFEAILSFAEFLNLNRRVDDDDPDTAQKAAEDADELSLTKSSKAPATRLKLHLDLAPEEADRERLSGVHVYPEWDARSASYLPEHVRVLVSDAEAHEGPEAPDARAARRIRAVRRQFEALRPRRVILPAQPDGDDLDLEALVRGRANLAATGESTSRIWRAARNQERDLAVSILLDVSRSTESAVTGRPVIDIEREALTALAWGLDAVGDRSAINAFSSLRRDRVFLRRVKRFDTPMSRDVECRIAGLRPGFYTRLGAAVRHVSGELTAQTRRRRLLLVITDGKPNDLDHYEGHHGIEDTRMAIREARRAGQAVFGITIDAKGKSWFPRIFGKGGYAVISHPDRLTAALPEIYRQLVSG